MTHPTPAGPDAADTAVMSREDLQRYRTHATQAVMIGTGFALEIINSHLALTAQRDRYREALEAIAVGRFPITDTVGNHYDLEGDHETDARNVYPARERWVQRRARAALQGATDE